MQLEKHEKVINSAEKMNDFSVKKLNNLEEINKELSSREQNTD